MKNCIALCFVVAYLTSATAQEIKVHNLISNETDTAAENGTVNSVASYYYFPNMEVYYDLDKKIYYYQWEKNWVISEELPVNYGGYSLFKNERIMITIPNGDEPQKYIKLHRKEYPYNAKGRIKRPSQILAENPSALVQ